MSRTRIDRLLVELGLFESRSKAGEAIAAGLVTAGGAPIRKASELVDPQAVITAAPAHPWVGRGGLKLDHALGLWPVAVEGRVVLDLGASTGGFSQVCLAKGAARIYAVDVGRGQLHPLVAGDPRVVELSGVDARGLGPDLIDTPPQLIVCDLSFIGLPKALPAALELAAPAADLLALVKPQFEVGPGQVGRGGLVRNATARAAALETVCHFVESTGWTVRGRADSPVLGGDGNHEYLLWANRS